MGETITKECDGWTIKAFEQIHIPPFQRFVAVARREVAPGRFEAFNVEAHSLKEAIERAKKRIRRGESGG
jgi:hypothetical protein